MRHIHMAALDLVLRRIHQCGKALAASLDEHSVSYWNSELSKANTLKNRIMVRFGVRPVVVHVDFINKRRKAA